MTPIFSRPLAARLLLGSALISFSALAYAQEADYDPLSDEIIVTGIGQSHSADELIGSATAIARDDLIDDMSATLGDTLAKQPGVSTTFFGQGASRPVLRGLGAERVLVLTNGLGVIDASAASPDHQVSADGLDAEKIEILRGPAALAYGGQAIGGVVNVIDGLITETPQDGLSGAAYVAGNSVNDGTELAAKAKIGAGPFVLSLSGSYRDFDNYEIPGFAESAAQRAAEAMEEDDHDEDHDEEGHEEEEEAFGLVENSFVETQTLSAGMSYIGETAFFGIAVRSTESLYGLPGHGHEHGHDDEDHDDETAQIFAGKPVFSEGDEDHDEEEEENAFIDLEQTRIDLRGGVDVSWGIWTELSGSLAFADYKHTEFEAVGEPGTVYEADGVEGRIELDHAVGAHDGTIGVQFYDKSLNAFGDEAFITPTDSQNFAVFGYEHYEWENGLSAEGGLRFDWTELSNIGGVTREYELLSASAGLHYHSDDGWFVGAMVSYVERAPNESELFANGPHLATDQFEVGNDNLSSEDGITFEATVRYDIEAFKIGANIYRTSFDDYIYLTPGEVRFEGQITDEAEGLPVFTFVQQNADFIGGEITGEIDFGQGWLGADYGLEASFDWVSAELGDGGNVPFLPPAKLTLRGEAEWEQFELSADIIRAADQDEPGLGQFATPGYTQIDLGASYTPALDLPVQPELFVQLRNATDEEIRYAPSVLKDLLPAPGRNWRVGLKAEF